ncbi:MAG TPA: nucleotide sugar dehydrogenase [Nitrososphaerales archaeon]|nr:nucleotide sugar dehydrogenase [Nitrososphaerales archaeon]
MNLLSASPSKITESLLKGELKTCVVGLGHVGLPLAVTLANEGVVVIGCDSNRQYLEELGSGNSPIIEHSRNLFPGSKLTDLTCPNCGVRILKARSTMFCPSCMRTADAFRGKVRLREATVKSKPASSASEEVSRLLKEAISSNRLSLTTSTTRAVASSDIIIITVGTPVDEQRRPETSALESAARAIGAGLKRGSLVVLRSTVSPGTTEGLLGKILRERSGLVPGKDFGLAHAPESTIEGLALFELWTLPKMVGGVDAKSARAAGAVLGVFRTPIHIFESPRITETAKLFENVYRDVNIALANELALACEALGVDVMKAIEAAGTDQKTNILTPGPGVGGYCLTKDAYYLTVPASVHGFVPNLLRSARDVNDSMPGQVHRLVRDAFSEAGLPVSRSKITILGLAFKGNTADTRESPSFPIIMRLLADGAKLTLHDPYTNPNDRLVSSLGLPRAPDVPSAVRGSSGVVILTDHLDYRSLTSRSLKRMSAELRVLVDARHVVSPEEAKSSGLVYRGVGQR